VEGTDPPRQLLAAQMNLSLVYCEVGRPLEVVRLLPGMTILARDVGGDAPTHLQWLRGTVARVQGEWDTALRIFFEVRSHFEHRRECLHYLESSLDVLRVYSATENWAPITELAIETSRVCRSMTQEPEILSVLAMLEQSALGRTLSELQIVTLGQLVRGRSRSAGVS
jgi:hypothetical protein